ncbi:nucleotidyltransferase family protein [Rhizobium leguminosarum]|uniref:hypothetical protein n=1 Tax=Rhizobium leguminosarum TaxID=384 RepID=UPI001C971B39|nr:hypothetical protein [Rhizobium leguminosarum]MBY5637702.1 nucleotidyltransferase family protein [Rhizobium leguminosarum]
MKETWTDERLIVSYALGGGNHSDVKDIEPDIILSVCQRHRIVGPYLKRLIVEQVRQTELEAILSADQRETVAKMLEDLPRIQSVLSLAERYSAVALIKGNTTFYREGDLFSARKTRDVDLVFQSASAVAAMMQECGSEQRKLSGRLDQHEVASFEAEGLVIDAHRFCQVIVRVATPDGAIVETAGLSFEDLAADLHTSVAGDFKILGPTMAALVTITHCYRDFVKYSSTTSRRKPAIRAGDLWDLKLAVNHPAFDIEKFGMLILAKGLGEQASLMAGLLKGFAGDSRLSAILGSFGILVDQGQQYPRLIFNCIWKEVSEVGEFASEQNFRTAVCRLQGSGEEVFLTGSAPVHPPRSGMMVHCRSAHREIDFECEISVESNLKFRVIPTWGASVEHRRVHLDVSGEIVEWNQRSDEDFPFFKTTPIGRELLKDWSVSPEGVHTIELHLDAHDIAARLTVPVIAAVGIFGEHPNIVLEGAVLPFLLSVHDSIANQPHGIGCVIH